ncbi:MAG: hypothetical protein BWY83_00284 [bacterium ADurb.Bin478]|nr:MAG: hypothetical protein BWY83_00284 [bacterium ADurb.Bin478]
MYEIVDVDIVSAAFAGDLPFGRGAGKIGVHLAFQIMHIFCIRDGFLTGAAEAEKRPRQTPLPFAADHVFRKPVQKNGAHALGFVRKHLFVDLPQGGEQRKRILLLRLVEAGDVEHLAGKGVFDLRVIKN